jgi:hypothetical protein
VEICRLLKIRDFHYLDLHRGTAHEIVAFTPGMSG